MRGAAVALTGWRLNRMNGQALFDPGRHDDTPQTVQGRRGVHDVDTVVAAVTGSPHCAPFVAGTLGRAILGPDVADDVVGGGGRPLRRQRARGARAAPGAARAGPGGVEPGHRRPGGVADRHPEGDRFDVGDRAAPGGAAGVGPAAARGRRTSGAGRGERRGSTRPPSCSDTTWPRPSPTPPRRTTPPGRPPRPAIFPPWPTPSGTRRGSRRRPPPPYGPRSETTRSGCARPRPRLARPGADMTLSRRRFLGLAGGAALGGGATWAGLRLGDDGLPGRLRRPPGAPAPPAPRS